jgi:hypothetical protein
MRSLRIAAVAALVAGLTAVPPAQAQEDVDKSDNVSVLANFPYTGGTFIDFGAGLAYTGQWDAASGGRGSEPDQGGVRIFKTAGKPRQMGFFHCPGNDTDVVFVRRGLVAVGHHVAACNPPDAGEANAGVYLLDVRNPRRPRQIGAVNLPSGGQTHTITRYPGKPLLYSNAGGLPTNGQMLTRVIDISNPRNPEIVGEFRNPAPPTGCHDVTFHFDERGKFGICAGFGATQIWDVSDPLEPSVVSTIVNPLINFDHFATASPDGELLVINDENLTVNDCVNENTPAGAFWVYDISNIQSPQLLSYYGPTRGQSPWGSFWLPGGHCTSHDFTFAGNRALVVPWFSGGLKVISLEDPSSPEEIAHYRPDGTVMWQAAYHRGRVYTNDMELGFTVLEVDGL